MNFNRLNRRRRFQSRFNHDSNRTPNKASALIKNNYRRYVESLKLHTRTTKEKLLLVGFSMLTGLMVLLTFSTIIFSLFLPSTKNAEALLNVESTVFFDRNGTVLYTVHGEQNREVVDSSTIPNVVKQAAVAIEDDRFFKHRGFDLPGIVKAVLSEIGIGRKRGGSTITQQFVKNAYLSRERTYTRKFKEIILATKIERNYTKDEILTMYLNKIPYGGTAYGVEKAAEVFFAKTTRELELPEAVILAALPQAPTYFSPFGNNRYSTLNKEFELAELQKRKIKSVSDLELAEYNHGLIGKSYTLVDGTTLYLPGRTDEVLRKMESLKIISTQERGEALIKIQNYEFNNYVASIKAPHFVFYIKELLESKYGKELVENGGLRVHTTLDYELYEESRKQITAQIKANQARFNVKNGATVTIDPQTGHILSMVGSIDYNNADIDGSVNMVTSSRQPGSSFKPLVYLTAFMRNSGAGTVLYDVPTKLDQDTPRNYDGTFRGPMSVRTALAQSRNIPAIKAYYLAGEQDAIISQVEKMGISTLDRRIDYGWPLALGSGEVKMLDMAESFGVLANGGERVAINPVLKITDNRGKVLEDHTKTQPKTTRVADADATYIINNILSDRTVNLGSALNLPDGRVAAIKTGTSTKKIGDTSFPSNLWAIGYTPRLVTVVWAGNSNGEEMKLGADGYNIAVPAWNKIMTYSLRNTQKVNFSKPDTVVSASVSKLSGKLPGSATPPTMLFSDLFTVKTVPKELDNSFYQATVDIRNNKRPNMFCPPEMVKAVTFYNPQSEIPGTRFNWRNEIIQWFEDLPEEELTTLQFGDKVIIGAPINEDSELCDPALANKFLDITILNLTELQVIPKGPFEVVVSPEAEAGISKIEFYLNSTLASSIDSAPFRAELRVPVGFPVGRKFTVKVKAIDTNGFSKEKTIELTTGESTRESLDWSPMLPTTDTPTPTPAPE